MWLQVFSRNKSSFYCLTPTSPRIPCSAIWKWYVSGNNFKKRNQPPPSQLRSLSNLVSDPLTMWTPQSPVAPGQQSTSTFIFGKFCVNLQSAVLSVYYLAVHSFVFPLTEILSAYPVILVIHYFYKRHMNVWVLCHFDSLLLYYVQLMVLFHIIHLYKTSNSL